MRSWIDASDEEIRLSSAIGFLVGDNFELKEFIFDPCRPRLRARPGLLRDDAWKFSGEDQLKIKAALDIWSGSGHLFLFEMIDAWSRPDWISFVKAVFILKGISAEALIDDELSLVSRFIWEKSC